MAVKRFELGVQNNSDRKAFQAYLDAPTVGQKLWHGKQAAAHLTIDEMQATLGRLEAQLGKSQTLGLHFTDLDSWLILSSIGVRASTAGQLSGGVSYNGKEEKRYTEKKTHKGRRTQSREGRMPGNQPPAIELSHVSGDSAATKRFSISAPARFASPLLPARTRLGWTPGLPQFQSRDQPATLEPSCARSVWYPVSRHFLRIS